MPRRIILVAAIVTIPVILTSCARPTIDGQITDLFTNYGFQILGVLFLVAIITLVSIETHRHAKGRKLQAYCILDESVDNPSSIGPLLELLNSRDLDICARASNRLIALTPQLSDPLEFTLSRTSGALAGSE